MRYDAALKFGGRVEDEAKGRLLAALSKASLEPDGKKVNLIIEDTLAKNWLQGQLKTNQHIFDYSFNTEIVKVSVDGLFQVLDSVFDEDELNEFKDGYKIASDEADSEKRKELFKGIAKKFAEGAAKAAGGGVMTALKAKIGI
ncbi:hypothetical protein DV711_15245 [Motiliproteus coralliicola]|uniref:Uncharacterized protein n=1 Tax=Motiliproteus coralliicola TaxID=2283196 RepID=A0A369WAX2_9GAMM|nr:hypothetical protein [Motiliproteus coralliicola]RDE18962.1 hypothetical protein DV711_15245 [Motiliproteus coralliicola]